MVTKSYLPEAEDEKDHSSTGPNYQTLKVGRKNFKVSSNENWTKRAWGGGVKPKKNNKGGNVESYSAYRSA